MARYKTKELQQAEDEKLHQLLSKNVCSSWNAARIKFVALFVNALIKSLTVNYKRLSENFDTSAKTESNLRRIQNFFAFFTIDKQEFARLMVNILGLHGQHELIIDRTNWKFGILNINILMLSIVYQGMSVPIFWKMMYKKDDKTSKGKRGNSDQLERIVLIDLYIECFGKERIKNISGDREFIGHIWFSYLIRNKIQFFMRIKKNTLISCRGAKTPVFWHFIHMRCNVPCYYEKPIKVYNTYVYLSGIKYYNRENKHIEYLIIASYKLDYDSIEIYSCRYQIEVMFKAFKTAGFNLEDTHLTNLERIDKLLTFLCFAFVWAYQIGLWKHQFIKPIKIKKHGRPEFTYFSYGLDFLVNAISANKKNFNICFKILDHSQIIEI